MKSSIKFAAALLSGGQSVRMQQDKAQLKINNQSLEQRQIKVLTQTKVSKIYNCDNKKIVDRYINQGPLAGIDALFQQSDFNDFDFCICLPVDMPNITSLIVEQLIDFSTNNNQSVAFSDSILPLVFPINDRVKNWLHNQLSNEKNWSIKAFSKFLNTNFIEIDSNYLLNINTPKQWAEYLHHERN